MTALPGCRAKADEFEYTEDSTSYASINDQDRRRRRCIVGAVWQEYWHQRDTSIYSSRKPDPPSHGSEDGMVNVEQKYEETSKEEEQGKVQQGG
jgi:hypothetical protein